MVGATEVIVGNAPMELSGVAGGLQQSTMQVGGSLGTAVLGAVMAARVDNLLPHNWAAAGLPAMPPAAEARAAQGVSVGVPPVDAHTPPHTAAVITHVAHQTFVSGMTLSFTIAAVVAAGAAAVAFFTKRGTNPEGVPAAVHA